MARKPYPSDVNDAEWGIIEPLLPASKPIGRRRQVDLREIINGIFYILHEGCTWRALPHDLPHWQTVYNYFRRWQQLGVWQEIHRQLRNQVRKSMNKKEDATAAIIDSQSVKTAEKKGSQCVGRLCRLEATGVEVYGYDGGKQIKGRKRFILVDTLGLVLATIVMEANCPERLGGAALVMEDPAATENLVVIWVDQGFSGDNFALLGSTVM